ncbi:hypothetical protein BDB00DRAFT_812577 [Zychaea mexicana]|uniref:uncharacterized protein n=1 Tax=Zychaea mexicana TaxID=64656 RepID=UPI0022FE9E2C|nr:uncharacterized protein BDB00DRAFT_812577 [Zychaea mexicana]KAI9495596.1 hypothetical protein BDB00DRAFT_812577 [Zychaea mexicana]
MAFFKKANVPSNILNEIWDAADGDKKGFLTDQEFCIALKLIACAQHGIIPASPVLKTSVPLPQLDGVPVQTPPPVLNTNRPTPASPNLQANNSGNDAILPEERNKYINIFQSSGQVDGILQADKARDIFLHSNLPPATLHQVWALADTRKSGTLNQTEFIIAMHYISRVMTGHPLPPTLPAPIYAAAASGRMLSPVMANRSSPTLHRQATGVFTGQQSHHPGRSEKDISPDEFVKYKGFFEKLDTNKSGNISGADAVVFFRHSKLPEADLARIWDLADTQQAGQLDVQQFAVAMHLINRRIAGGQIPSALPDNVFTQQPAFANAAAAPQQPAVDLLDLGSDASQAQQQPHPQQPVATGSTIATQRSDVEANLASVRAETLAQTDRNNQLRTQLNHENDAIRELEQALEREKATLESLKQNALEAERQLAQAKEKKEGLTQELQMYKQEANHFQQRGDKARHELQQQQQQQQQPSNSNTATSTDQQQQQQQSSSASSPAPSNDFFTLSSVPANELFAKVPETSPTTSPHSAASPARRTFDPFAGFKESNSKSATSSPTVSLNRLKEDAVAKQQARAGTPNVDISAIEAKFPDLSTMEQNFQTPASTGNSASASAAATAGGSSTPIQSHATAGTPSTPKQTFASPSPRQQPSQPFTASPRQPFAASPQLQQQQPNPAFSPSQAKSVAKYGFDLSAFEGESSTASTTPTGHSNNNSSSVKDDLNSLFGSPSPAQQQQQPGPEASKNNNSSNFDDIFGVPSSTSSSQQPQQRQQPERKPTFDEMFFP